MSSNANPLSSGHLTITSIDTTNKRINGTFAFNAWRATDNTFKNITAGEFENVTYTTTINSTGNNTFTIKIDNVTFTPAVITGTYVQMMNNIMINAADNVGSKAVGLTVPSTVTPGTYNLAPFGTYSGQYNPNAQEFNASTSGTITISSHNVSTKNIVGTCSFIAEPLGGGPPTYNLTAGAFNITYQ